MRENDYDEFAQLLDAAFDLIGKTPAAKIISPTSKALFFQALADYPLPQVREAIGAHIKRGKFTPTPADLIEHIAQASAVDTRPGGEEAWALALATLDDVRTVVWTQEAAEAFGKAQTVLEASGPISARKTFLEIYERLVAANRRNGVPVSWFVSPGSDGEMYRLAVNSAQVAGYLPPPAPVLAIAAPENEAAPSLSPRDQLAVIRSMLLDGVDERQRLADEAIQGRIEEEDDFKRDLARRVAERQAFILMADQAQVARAEAEKLRAAGEP